MYLPQALDTAAAAGIESRQLGGGGTRYRTRRRSPWSSWGRWVLAGILILMGLMLLFIFLCITRRRRRRQQLASTQAPMTNYGGGSGAPVGGEGYKYGSNNQNQGGYQGGYGGGAPPNYGNGAANDYYAPQQGGVAQPQGAYVR